MPELTAQNGVGTPISDEHRPPAWVGQFTVLGFNAVLGGVTAGLRQRLEGGSFEDGFTRGFLGGGIIYAGKRLAAEGFPAAGLMGRGVAAAGGSIVRNAAEGRASLDRMIVPIGPVRLYLDAAQSPRTRVKLDVNSLVVVAFAAVERDLDFDVSSSLSAGAPVFRTTDHLIGTADDTVRASGKVVESVIFLSDLAWRTADERREIFAHERIHVLQRDQVFVTFTEPLGAGVIARVPVLSSLYSHLDFHFTDLVFSLLSIPFSDYYDRPWELEAFHLSRR